MQLGVMNDPRRDASDELRWAVKNGFDFLDLTIEGPGAALDQLDLPTLQNIVAESGIGIIGHTAPYLPFASPVRKLRQTAVECVAELFELLASLGARGVTVHIMTATKLFEPEDWWNWNSECFAELAERAAPYGLQIFVEHPPRPAINVAVIKQILAADARLGFHLDVGHAFVGGDRLESLLGAFNNRLVHVHMSDNRGSGDDHRTLGDGFIDWPRAVQLLHATGYDKTITLEVQSPDREYVLISARKLRQWWAEAGERTNR